MAGRIEEIEDDYSWLRLTEELKWGQPCYTFQEKNVVLIHGFKDIARSCLLKVFC